MNQPLPADLDGYDVYPGLINAHDHLELNHFPRSKFREVYGNAHQWGEDVSARLDESPYREGRAVPLEARLFLGGLKNLLCGATTVAHHNPPHRALFRRDFPVRVVRQYGWAHSLHFSSAEEIQASYRKTPPGAPWIIHLAEGTDEIAAGEYRRLKALGCVGPNTVIVHGVGLTDEDIADAAPRIRGLIWCPSTNLYLLGRTANVRAWIAAGGRVALGSDSRLTGDGDLLDELAATQPSPPLAPPPQGGRGIESALFSLPPLVGEGQGKGGKKQPLLDIVTILSTSILNLSPAPADWIALPAGKPLAGSRRADLALVVRGGLPQIGDAAVMAHFPRVQTVSATLDGTAKRIHLDLAHRIVQYGLKEPGLEIDDLPPSRKWWTFRVRR